MQPDEIRAARGRLKLSQQALANLLGVTSQAVYYWESGGRVIGEPSARLLKLYLDKPELIR